MDNCFTKNEVTDAIADQWISRAKLALSLAIIKQKPSSQTGEEYARVLAQDIRRYQQDLVTCNQSLKEENSKLFRKLALHQLAGSGDSGFCSSQGDVDEHSLNLERNDCTIFGDHLKFSQSLVCLKSHLKMGLGSTVSTDLSDTFCRSLSCIFRFLPQRSALVLPDETLNDAFSTLVALCEFPWPQDVCKSVHICCLEFSDDLLRNMHLVNIWLQQHYTRILCRLGRSGCFWVKVCDKLVRKVQTFSAGATEKQNVDPLCFQAIYSSLNALEMLWDNYPEQGVATFPGTDWISALESSVRDVWEHLPLFHIYVTYLQNRLNLLMCAQKTYSRNRGTWSLQHREMIS